MFIRNRQLNGLNASLKLNTNNSLTVRNRYNPNVQVNSGMVARDIPLDRISRVDYRQRTATSGELIIKSRDRERSPMRTDVIKVDQHQMHHFRKLQQTITRQIHNRPARRDPELPDLTYRGFNRP